MIALAGNFADFATVVATLVAISALAYQIHENSKARRDAAADVLKAQKLSIIGDLVAYRYVLTENGPERVEASYATAKFNAALSKIPIEFIENSSVLALYSDFGNEFTALKFFELVKHMLLDAKVEVPEHFTMSLLQSVPSRNIIR